MIRKHIGHSSLWIEAVTALNDIAKAGLPAVNSGKYLFIYLCASIYLSIVFVFDIQVECSADEAIAAWDALFSTLNAVFEMSRYVLTLLILSIIISLFMMLRSNRT